MDAILYWINVTVISSDTGLKPLSLPFQFHKCGNYGNLLSQLFGKNFVKTTFSLLLKLLELIWRDFFAKINFLFAFGKHSVEIFFHNLQKFRESNVLLKKLLKSCFDEFFLNEREFLIKFSTLQWKNEKNAIQIFLSN